MVDVRTPEEYAAGHSPGARCVPWMLKGDAGMVPNPSFVAEFKKAYPDTSAKLLIVRLVVVCRCVLCVLARARARQPVLCVCTSAPPLLSPHNKKKQQQACQSGRRSTAACAALAGENYGNLVDSTGGWGGWTAAGLPVEK